MPLERINLNVPPELRARLRTVAKRLKRTESEVIRELLASALERAEREEFHRAVQTAMSPEVRRRMLEVTVAFERGDE
jgi:predicted DNA-binding protein